MKHILRRVIDPPLLHITLILAAGCIIYSNTLNVPFHLDEFYIKDNPIVKGIDAPDEVIRKAGLDLYDHSYNRYIAYLTFAFNYKLGGFNVFGYHIVNLSLHLLTALLVYALVFLTFKTPIMEQSALREKRLPIALFVALIFVAHPIQTEAVNWIWQRVAVLVAFLYIAALVAYVRARLEKKSKVRMLVYYFLALAATVLAMRTKQNSFTIPVMIALYEAVFFSGPVKARLMRLVPFAATMSIIPYTYLYILGYSFKRSTEGIWNPLAADIGRGEFLITQLRVMVTNVRLLFWPVNLPIFHEYDVSPVFFSMEILLSTLFVGVLLGSGLYLVLHFRGARNEYALIGFGILWFFVAIAVESLVPQYTLLCNYRLYLPSVGMILAVVSFLFVLGREYTQFKKRFMAGTLVLCVLILGVSTYIRNEVWATEVSLQQDTVKNNPKSPTAHFLLGNAYKREGNLQEANREFDLALRLDEEASAVSAQTKSRGVSGTGIALLKRAVRPGDAESHYNLAVEYYRLGQPGKALSGMRQVVALENNHVGAHYFIGLIAHDQERYDEAIREYQLVIALKPDFVEARTNLGGVYGQLGRYEEAMAEVQAALRIAPEYAAAHRYLGLIYQDLGRLDESIAELKTALRINPDYAEAHNNLGEIYVFLGKGEDAVQEFLRAIKADPDLVAAKVNLERATGAMGGLNR